MKSPIATDTSALKRNPNYRAVFMDFEVLRHETIKQPFRTIFWITVIANCVALAWFTY